MHPTMTVELEYIDTGAPDEFDEDYEQGLLTVELLDGRNLLRVKDLPPNPMAHVSCAKQTYTSARKLKTSQPKFNERFGIAKAAMATIRPSTKYLIARLSNSPRSRSPSIL